MLGVVCVLELGCVFVCLCVALMYWGWMPKLVELVFGLRITTENRYIVFVLDGGSRSAYGQGASPGGRVLNPAQAKIFLAQPGSLPITPSPAWPVCSKNLQAQPVYVGLRRGLAQPGWQFHYQLLEAFAVCIKEMSERSIWHCWHCPGCY